LFSGCFLRVFSIAGIKKRKKIWKHSRSDKWFSFKKNMQPL
jgi:hypothetical protein